MPGTSREPRRNLQRQFAGRQHLEAVRVWKQEEGSAKRRVDLEKRGFLRTDERFCLVN